MEKKLITKIGQMKLISKLTDGKDLQRKRVISLEVKQTNVADQNQETFLDLGEEDYRFPNSLIPEEPRKLSK